jgi:hypothetical protein
MSNKILIPVIIVLSLITIGVASLTQLNKAPEKVTMNTNQSSEIVSSIKSQIVSSSSLVQSLVSSTSVVSSTQKVVESVKNESHAATPNTAKCNLPESENLVKTEDGCFVIGVNKIFNFSHEKMDGNYINSDPKNPPYSEELEYYYKNILGVDFYNRVKNLSISRPIEISVTGTTKISDNLFKIRLNFSDTEYLKSINTPPSGVSRFGANYVITLGSNKTFVLESFYDAKNQSNSSNIPN